MSYLIRLIQLLETYLSGLNGSNWTDQRQDRSNPEFVSFSVLFRKQFYLILYISVWPALWLGGQSFWLLAIRSRVRFLVLLWEFSLAAEDPHSDHGLGSLETLGVRPLLVLHAHTYHHSHYRDNLTAPCGSSNLRSGHNQEGGHEVYMDMWRHWGGGGGGNPV
jgi:hypothetical protein